MQASTIVTDFTTLFLFACVGTSSATYSTHNSNINSIIAPILQHTHTLQWLPGLFVALGYRFLPVRDYGTVTFMLRTALLGFQLYVLVLLLIVSIIASGGDAYGPL